MPRSGNIRALTTRSRSSADTSATTGGVFSKQTLPTGIATRPSPLKQQCGESVTRTDSRGLRGPTLQPSLPDTSQFRILVRSEERRVGKEWRYRVLTRRHNV